MLKFKPKGRHFDGIPVFCFYWSRVSGVQEQPVMPFLYLGWPGLGHHDLQAISRTPFTQLGANPLPGSFDAYVPPLRECLLPNLLAMPIGDRIPTKTTTYTIYASSMILSVFLFARALRVDRAPALFAGLLYPLFALPMFIGSLLTSYPIYAIAPHAAQMTSLTLLTLACFWALEEETFFRSVLLALAALFCTVWMVLSSAPTIVLAIPALVFFGAAFRQHAEKLIPTVRPSGQKDHP
jgi:hypothetical protein